MAQWLGHRISDQGVPDSNPGRCTFRCGLKHIYHAQGICAFDFNENIIFLFFVVTLMLLPLFGPRHEKIGFLHMRKQSRRSVVR